MVLQERFKTIFTAEEISRIHISEHLTGISVVVDVHGLKCSQARRFVNNLINIARCPFIMTVIHGYNHGTAILEIIRGNLENRHIVQRFPDPYNRGVTHLTII